MPRGLTTLAFALCVGLFVLGGAFVVLRVPFPTPYDELQHVSFIVALREAPTLFPSYGSYRVLDETLTRWTDAQNYLAHPSLYYLLLAPFGNDVALLRAINLAMATAGFALCAGAGVRLLATTTQRLGFLALSIVFSKPALMSGMVNNDNLVLLETGVLLWMLARSAPACHDRSENRLDISAVAILLALVGWTKFNAFVGLTLFVGLLHLFDVLARRQRLFGRTSWLLLAGVGIGAIPTLSNLATFGTPAWVPTDFLYVDPSLRQNYDFSAFVAAFWHKIGLKILYIDGIVDLTPVVIATVVLAACTTFAPPSRRRDLAVSATLATLAFATLHTLYGWNSFRSLGSMSDAQSRYYTMLWPMLAMAAVLGMTALLELRTTRGRPALYVSVSGKDSNGRRDETALSRVRSL